MEFIGQIGHDNHAYLQLNSRDATLFVYKKIINEINNDHKKNIIITEEERERYKKIYDIVHCFNELIVKIVKKEKKICYDNFLLNFKLIDKIIIKIKKNYNIINKKILIMFLDKMIYMNEENNKFMCLEIINIFVNKLIKNKISKNFELKLSSCNNIIQIEKLSSVKYVNWLIK